MIRIAVAALLVIAGCATTSRPLRAMQVADHAGEILRDGRARIPGEAGEVTVGADEVIEVRLMDADGVERPARITVRTLVEGCAGDATSPACLASRVVDEPVVTHRHVRIDPDKVSQMVFVAGVGAGLGWCAVACEDPDREFRRGATIAGGVAVGAVVLFSMFLLGPD